jgi:hypothetical protein
MNQIKLQVHGFGTISAFEQKLVDDMLPDLKAQVRFRAKRAHNNLTLYVLVTLPGPLPRSLNFFFFITLGLEMSDTNVYEP